MRATAAAVARKTKHQTNAPATFAKLRELHPDAHCELDHRTPFELLVATVLSAQSTDKAVNQVTPALFERWPDAATMAKASQEDVEKALGKLGMFRQKSKNVIGLSKLLVERHRGQVPRTLDELVALPGVGRKTANVVLGHALGVPGLPVDRHVLRVTNRIGIASGDDPVKVERQLCDQLPPEQWTLASDCLILHGRRVCRPSPQCPKCVLNDMCLYAVGGGRMPRRAATRPKR